MELEAADAEFSGELNEHLPPNQWSREDITFIDPATILFEITFGCRLVLGIKKVSKLPGSSNGVNMVLNIWF